MRLALATCTTVPAWEKDDRPLVLALEAAGAEVSEPAWDDPAFDWRRVDAVLVRTTWDYMARAEVFAAWAERAGRATRFFNPPEVVRWNLDKRYLRDLSARGVPIAPTEWLAAGDDAGLEARLAARGWPRAFLKPVIGASALGTLRFTADLAGFAAARAHLRATSAPAGFILQPYLRRVETEGEVSLIYFDGRLSHAVRKTPVAGDYRVQDDYGAADAPHLPRDDERALAEAALAAVPFAGPLLYARVDLLRDDEGRPVLVELELIEPSLFFRHAPEAAAVLAAALIRRLGRPGASRR